MRLFLFGTLLWPDLLARVAGRPVSVTPARLAGHGVLQAIDGDWPVLVRGGGDAVGAVTEPLTPDILARLDWYESGYGYGRGAITVQTDDGPVQAERYLADPDGHGTGNGPWGLADWIETHGKRTMIAANEIMRAQGRWTEADLAQMRGVIHARAGGIADAALMDRPATVGGELQASAVGPLDRKHNYDGFLAVEELSFDHARFDGGRVGPIKRAVAHIAQAATVLPYDPVRDCVLLVEQIRAAAVALTDPQPWMLEPVAGIIDAGDTPLETALREAREEAGLSLNAERLHFVARYYPSPGGLAQILYSYVGCCDLPDGIAGLGGLDTEAEDIRGHLVSFDDLMGMVASGEAANAPLILSAQWLALNRSHLR